ncbi:MAG TPA: DNA cytosine methyltransferase, partial [Verrucomicrobiae bacterium]|nr:DNA cytosine methyltransferase [Verrucomicrobiae bacterium]
MIQFKDEREAEQVGKIVEPCYGTCERFYALDPLGNRNKRQPLFCFSNWKIFWQSCVMPKPKKKISTKSKELLILHENSAPYRVNDNGNGVHNLRFIDLFCGIGGFRLAIESVAKEFSKPIECVFSSDIDEDCRNAYNENFGENPHGDITEISADIIPAHDI